MSFKDRFNDLKLQNISDNILSQKAEQIKSQNPIADSIKSKLSSKIASVPVWFDYSEDEKLALISSFFDNWLKESDVSLSEDERARFIDSLKNSAYGFGELDSVLSDDLVSEIFISAGSPVKIRKSGEILSTDISITAPDILVSRLKKVAGLEANKQVLKFIYANLIITMVLPPVSNLFIAIKKKTRKNTDFEFLLNNNKIDQNIYSFLVSLINNKKNILISGGTDCGKTSYIESFYNILQNSILLQNTNFIDKKSFICGGLCEEELKNLINAVARTNPDYLVCDMNNGYLSVDGCALISTMRAESAVFAVTKLAANNASASKMTEKQAKADIASHFDYIIHLNNEMFISSIAEFSLNKAGSLVMTEILSYKDGVYAYNFPEEMPVLPSKQVKSAAVESLSPNSFKARFK